jgi:hypothetical protein
MKKILLIFIVVGICGSGISYGDEYSFIYKGLRPMGMGGAFVAVSNDANALFYNPAGLADITEVRGVIFPLELEISDNAIDIYSDAKDVDFDDEKQTADFLREYIGERSHVSLNFVPNFSMPQFAFALIGTSNINLEVRDRQYPKIITDIISDVGAGVGYAHPLFENSLLLGGSLKYIYRNSLIKEYTVLDITSDDLGDKINDDLKDGNGVLLDLGAIYKLDRIGLSDAQVGVSANNLIGNDLGDARDVDEHLDIGFAITRKLWITDSTFAIDYFDLFSQVGNDNDMAKRIRLGAEFRFPKVLSIRVGLYQGYFTSGLTVDGRFVSLDLLTYAEEIGSYAGQRSDRRYAMRLAIGF